MTPKFARLPRTSQPYPGTGRDASVHPLLPSSSNRWQRGAWIFRDRTLQGLEILLDEAFRIPFTPVRFGLDAIIGLIPFLGDAVGGVLSLVIPLAAWMRGVPYITLVRMLANTGVGVLVGSIPLFGDIFDLFWKANRRNYALLQRHVLEPQRRTGRDWIYLAGLLLAIAAVLAIPVVLFLWLVLWLLSRAAHQF